MAKAPKKQATPITPDMIDKAARTSVVVDLVRLAEAFARAGIHGPFSTVLPLLTACHVQTKGYRRHNVPVGTKVDAGSINIGKRDGLIFVLPINGLWECDKGPVEWIEMGWDDVVNTFGELADKIDERMGVSDSNQSRVREIDTAVKAAIAKNPAMHKVLTDGFKLAQTHKKEQAVTEEDQSNPMWGQF